MVAGRWRCDGRPVIRTRRERNPWDAPSAPTQMRAPASAHLITALQRSAGNGAVSRLLARQPAAVAQESGIGSSENLVAYVAAARVIFENWDTYPTPQARVDALLKLLNAEIAAAGGEPIWGAELTELEYGIDGKFLSTKWSMQVDLNLFTGSKPGAGWAARAATVAHEARHCEQFFLAARLLGASGRSTEAVAQALHMPMRPVEAAKRMPLDPESPQADEAERFAESICGAGARDARRVHRELRHANQAYEQAKLALDNATAEDRPLLQEQADAAWQRVSDAIDAYKALPMEADAFALGREVERVFREGR
jgi:hypothetical protein